MKVNLRSRKTMTRGLIMPLLVSALLATGCVRLIAEVIGTSPGQPALKSKFERNVMVPMRDGVKLATDLYLPGDGAYPVVLMRIPYGTESAAYQELAKLFTRNGYVFVAQDTRGEFDSEGDWFPMVFEFEDGHDTVAWVKNQKWCNGKIGMFGGSYFGYTQLESAPDNPDLTCMAPLLTTGNMVNVIFRNGVQMFFSIQGWLAEERTSQLKRNHQAGEVKPDFSGGYFNEPLRDALTIDYEKARTDKASVAAGPEAWLHHPGDIELIPPMNYEKDYEKVTAPSLLIAGWYDIFLGPQLHDFMRFREVGQGNAKKTRIVLGPWRHGIPSLKPEDKPFEGFEHMGSFMPWYDYWLKGIQNGAGDAAPVKIFVMGENLWRDEQEWPLARTKFTNLFLQGQGKANTQKGDGKLSFDAAAGEPDKYDYDPNHPVPTAGGNFLGNKPFPAGPQDQGNIPNRPDVLVYQTEPLKAALEVTGPIKLVLFAASSAKDTDWVAKLLDRDEKGNLKLIQEGVVRARYRNGYQHPTLIEPGQVVEYTLDMWATSNLFKPGHRLVLLVTSSDFPQFDRNANAGGEGGPNNILTAHQTIYHNPQYPSHLVLPVIPR